MIWMSLLFLTFVTGAVVDFLWRRGKAPAEISEGPAAQAQANLAPGFVEGFLIPGELRYHPGHMWLKREWQDTVRVGADEFGAKLAGKIDRIDLPKPGQWFRQGQALLELHRRGDVVTMVSPIEGEVTAINPDVAADPSLLRRDSYGKGWLVSLRVYDQVSPWRNLLPANLVRSWMKDAVTRLYAEQPSMTPLAADGERPVEDLLGDLPDAEWHRVTAEFFLA
jgi:glycine cleavage system H protein